MKALGIYMIIRERLYTYHWRIGRRAFLWSLEVMLCHIDIADDVVVNLSVLSGAEVPGLFLGEVWPLLQTLHLVLEIYNIEGLFISQCSIL